MRTVSKLLLTAFLLVAASLFFWSLVRAPAILARDDNPRLLEAEQRIQRGTIFDRHGQILAQNIGPPERQERHYPFSTIGPAVGYYSLTYGTTGIEAAFDPQLRGSDNHILNDYWRRALHLPQIGEDIRLELDADLQVEAQRALANHNGAVLLLNMPRDGSNRAQLQIMASSPGYDPNLIDDQFEQLGQSEDAPLLNRVTQGQYQPGLLLQPLIVAYAVDQDIIQLSDIVQDPQRPVEINGRSQGCITTPPNPSTWADVLYHHCPGPLQNLADQLGVSGLDALLAAFELDRDPDLELNTTTTPDDPTVDPLTAAIGQENLSVTPLSIGLAMAALVGNGTIPQAHLTVAENIDHTRFLTRPSSDKPVIRDEAARQAVLGALPTKDDLHEIGTLVISGPQGSTNAWYVGARRAVTSDQIVVVVLEGSDNISEAAEIGRTMINASK
jgi:peptidoglycan glycosyltransferase